MQPDLKPCPFCGKQPEIVGSDADDFCQISCGNIDCFATFVRQNEASAVAAWNRRVAEPEPPVTQEES